MKRAWAYFRCSTDQQERSIPDQKKAMQPILQEHGIEIVETFEDEGVSGVDPVAKRPEFFRMQSMVQTGAHRQQDVTCVLCYDISRWGRFRDPLDSIAYMQEFKRAGLPIYFTDDKYVQFAADTRQAANAILAVLGSMEATGYSEERSKLVLRGKRSVAEDGFWTGGITPYAMVRVVLGKDGKPEQVLNDGEQKVVKDRRVVLAPGPPEKVRVVQTIFDLRAQKMGYGSIAKCLNQRGIPPTRSNRWSGSAVYRILKNPVYAGKMVFGKRNVSKFNEMEGGLIWRPESEWVKKEGVWDSIIDRKTWEKVQESFGGTSRRYSGSADYPLSGIIQCAKCGWNFYGNTVKSNGSHYHYYVHRQNRATIPEEKTCRSFNLPQALVEDFVLQEVKKALLGSDVQKYVADYIRQYVDAATGEAGEKMKDINRQLAEIKEKENNVRQAMEEGVDPSFVVQSLQRLQEERLGLEGTQAGFQKSRRILDLTGKDVSNICCAVGDYLVQLEDTLEAGGPERRREVLRTVVDQIVVDRPANTATVYIRRIPEMSGVTDLFLNRLDNKLVFVYHNKDHRVKPFLWPM